MDKTLTTQPEQRMNVESGISMSRVIAIKDAIDQLPKLAEKIGTPEGPEVFKRRREMIKRLSDQELCAQLFETLLGDEERARRAIFEKSIPNLQIQEKALRKLVTRKLADALVKIHEGASTQNAAPSPVLSQVEAIFSELDERERKEEELSDQDDSLNPEELEQVDVIEEVEEKAISINEEEEKREESDSTMRVVTMPNGEIIENVGRQMEIMLQALADFAWGGSPLSENDLIHEIYGEVQENIEECKARILALVRSSNNLLKNLNKQTGREGKYPYKIRVIESEERGNDTQRRFALDLVDNDNNEKTESEEQLGFKLVNRNTEIKVLKQEKPATYRLNKEKIDWLDKDADVELELWKLPDGTEVYVGNAIDKSKKTNRIALKLLKVVKSEQFSLDFSRGFLASISHLLGRRESGPISPIGNDSFLVYDTKNDLPIFYSKDYNFTGRRMYSLVYGPKEGVNGKAVVIVTAICNKSSEAIILGLLTTNSNKYLRNSIR